MHDGVIVISQAHGVDLFRGELVKVVLLTNHNILPLYLHPVVPVMNLQMVFFCDNKVKVNLFAISKFLIILCQPSAERTWVRNALETLQ